MGCLDGVVMVDVLLLFLLRVCYMSCLIGVRVVYDVWIRFLGMTLVCLKDVLLGMWIVRLVLLLD